MSYLCGDFRIFQKRHGHRWSLDDLLTAWVATAPLVGNVEPLTTLDLGCGLGSVLMMTAWALPSARCVGVEVQADRFSMAQRSLRFNGLEDRCQVFQSDLRALTLPQGVGPFQLITCTPPYFPVGTAVAADTDEAAACRIETRGGVEAYLSAAAPLLAPNGRIVMVTSALQRDRVKQSAGANDLHLAEHLEVIPLEGKEALICVDTFKREAGPQLRATLTVRQADHSFTSEFKAVREAMGLPYR